MLIVAHLITKFPIVYGTQRLITVFKRTPAIGRTLSLATTPAEASDISVAHVGCEAFMAVSLQMAVFCRSLFMACA